ncbi:superinfection immunity protein [Paraburkholderia silvatlantica]|uniref:T4 superinfection immunity protein n=1 Tax=Paraburkholderia silvatlantica TaxID=321895 RepID=A0A2V4TJE9_9BURK|nr:superinfection immunity protein [Paraburkholderia silvatlantica]PYE21368.1 T4 superinfection immunity protein [Paraburkholderia silvatlantica]TDQ92392.1 T4 superinfection immunity protein [Paraburkholderia silvatlantica]
MSNYQSSTDAADTPSDSGGPLVMLVLLYFVPSIIAFHCMHRKRRAITRLNILLGWSVLGWIVAFLWALTSVDKEGSAMSKRVRKTARISEEARTVFR